MPKRKHYSVVNNKGFLQRFEAVNDAAAKEICKVQGWKPIPTRKPKAKNKWTVERIINQSS